MTLTFRQVSADDRDLVVTFLRGSAWPFHSRPNPSPAEAADVTVSGEGVDSYWVVDDGRTVGLVRLLDLDDVEDGSPVFDLRIAGEHRGRGHGVSAVYWLTSHLFDTYPVLHRIEATTRHDNLAMQAVFRRCGYRHEGTLLEAWANGDGSYADTLIYGVLRHEWVPGTPQADDRRS